MKALKNSTHIHILSLRAYNSSLEYPFSKLKLHSEKVYLMMCSDQEFVTSRTLLNAAVKLHYLYIYHDEELIITCYAST